MQKKEYLTEEAYQKSKKKIKLVAAIILIVGLTIGGTLIGIGISNKNKIDSKYSEENKESEMKRIKAEIAEEKETLSTIKADLESKGVEYDAFTEYDDGESYQLKIVSEVLNPRYDRCFLAEYKENNITQKYCSLQNELDEVENTNVEFERNLNSSSYIPFFIFGVFVIIVSCMIAGINYMRTKGREMLAFGIQQVRPIAEEGMEKMAPSIGRTSKTIAKDIAEGIREGYKENQK